MKISVKRAIVSGLFSLVLFSNANLAHADKATSRITNPDLPVTPIVPSTPPIANWPYVVTLDERCYTSTATEVFNRCVALNCPTWPSTTIPPSPEFLQNQAACRARCADEAIYCYQVHGTPL